MNRNLINTLRQRYSLWVMSALAAPVAIAAGGSVALDRADIDLRNVESIQRGAQTFVNHCLSCHGAQAMRYNRMTDLGLTKEQIRDNLLLATDKVGDTMRVAMTVQDAKNWLGAPPPDLSVVARSRGKDWLYTYMRTFYQDSSRPTGWNNVVFDKVGMPHIFWQEQGEVQLQVVDGKVASGPGVFRSWVVEHHDDTGTHAKTHQLVLSKPGSLSTLTEGKANTLAYDRKMSDLVAYLTWMGEPAQVQRERLGYGILAFLLALLVPLSYFLKQEYWRDIH